MGTRVQIWYRLVVALVAMALAMAGAMATSGCGAITTSVSTGDSGGSSDDDGDDSGVAPPVSIPVPIVTKITISVPSNGVATITGTAGAVTAGNLVRAVNLTQTGTAWQWELLLWDVALAAATTVETTAAADGSFTMDIAANVGDKIRITQIDSAGNASTALDLTASFTLLTRTQVPLDLVVDPDAATAYMLDLGQVTPVNLGSSPALGTSFAVPSGCTNPLAFELDATDDFLYLIDGTNARMCRIKLDGTVGGNFGSFSDTFINLCQHPTARKLVAAEATTNDDTVTVQVVDLGTTSQLPSLLIAPGGTPTPRPTGVPSIAAGTTIDSQFYALVIVAFDDGKFYPYIVNLSSFASTVISGPALSGVTTPRELRIYDNTQAVLVDGAGKAHILAINVSSGSVTVASSVTVGSDPVGVTIDTTNAVAYVTNRGSDTVSKIRLSDGNEAVTATYTLADGPSQIIHSSTAAQIAVTHETDKGVVVLSP